MYRLSSLAPRLVVASLLLSLLVLVPALACTGPQGPAGQTGPAGPTGPAATALPAPTLQASVSSIAFTNDPITSATIAMNKVTFTGAGWIGEKVVAIELLIDGKEQMLIAGIVNDSGAFKATPAAGNKFEVKPGIYTVRGTGKLTGSVAYVPVTITITKPVVKK